MSKRKAYSVVATFRLSTTNSIKNKYVMKNNAKVSICFKYTKYFCRF